MNPAPPTADSSLADSSLTPSRESLASAPCPKCHGVPVAPEIEGCAGCSDCDFTGTLVAYEKTQQMFREANESWIAYIQAGICAQCGATCPKEAESKCTPSQDDTGEYSCAGTPLWEENQIDRQQSS